MPAKDMTNGNPAGGRDSPRCCQDCDIPSHGDINSLHYRDNDTPGYGYCDSLCCWNSDMSSYEDSENSCWQNSDIYLVMRITIMVYLAERSFRYHTAIIVSPASLHGVEGFYQPLLCYGLVLTEHDFMQLFSKAFHAFGGWLD